MERESRLQCRFENYLLDVKWTQYAVNFCGSLLKASRDIQKLEMNSNGMSNKEAEKALKELQVITDSTGDNIVNPLAEKFLERFYFDDSVEGRSKKATVKEVLVSILKIDEHERVKYTDAKDYLQQMINTMVSLVKDNNLKMCHIYKRYDPLDEYLYTLTHHRDNVAALILNSILNRWRLRRKFTEEQQKKVGDLMIGAIGPVLTYIKCYCSNRHFRMPSSLEYRSALKILYDEYGKFPAGSATLHQEFKKVNMMKTLEILNSNIRMKSIPYNEYDSDEDRSDIKIYRVSDLTKIYRGSDLHHSHMEWRSNVGPSKQIK